MVLLSYYVYSHNLRQKWSLCKAVWTFRFVFQHHVLNTFGEPAPSFDWATRCPPSSPQSGRLPVRTRRNVSLGRSPLPELRERKLSASIFALKMPYRSHSSSSQGNMKGYCFLLSAEQLYASPSSLVVSPYADFNWHTTSLNKFPSAAHPTYTDTQHCLPQTQISEKCKVLNLQKKLLRNILFYRD